MAEQEPIRSISLWRDLTYVFARAIKRLRISAIRSSSIHVSSKVESGCQVVNSSFDKHSYCGYDCTIINVHIGSFTSIADKVNIGGSGHPMHFVSTSPVFLSHKDSVRSKFAHFDYLQLPETYIGSDVWIGRCAQVKAGVKIDHGAVVATGAVVTKDVPAYAVVAGNPAKVVKYRFEEKIIDKLLSIKWWNMEEKELKHWAQWFNDPEEFLQRWHAK